MPEGNKSVVMNASTDLMTGKPEDSQVQVTLTPDGTAFLTAYFRNDFGNRENMYLRISADEWERLIRWYA